MRICEIDRCDSKHKAKGYCGLHYSRIKLGLNPLGITSFDRRQIEIGADSIRIPLGKNASGGHATIDKENYWLGDKNWLKSATGYPCVNIKGRWVTMHTLLIAHPERGMVVDHIDRDKMNNRLSNLRMVSRQQNSMNSPSHVGTSSVYKGVTFDKENGRWRAVITMDKISYRLGRYDYEVDAALAYDLAAVQLHGEFAVLNIL